MLKRIAIFICFLSCDYNAICQNVQLFNLVDFVITPHDSAISFLRTPCFTVRDVGEVYGTEDNYLKVSINNKSYYIEGELLGVSIDTTPCLYVKYPLCCAAGVTLYQCYTVDSQKDTLMLVEQLSMSDAIKLPLVQNMEPKPFTYNINAQISLRTAPLVDDTTWNYDLRQNGNECGTIVSGAEGYILSYAFSKTGDKFYFVALKNNKASSVFQSDYKGNDTFFLCWIKSEFL